MEPDALNRRSSPVILIAYPSCFYYVGGMERVEMKTSQLLLASFINQYYPVQYADFELSIGQPNTAVQIRRYERKVREFFENSPCDILALSCWTSLSYKATLTAARIWRELNPRGIVVVGGYHASARPQEFVTDDNLIDYVICGEGELPLKDIADHFPEQGRPDKTVIVRAATFPQDKFIPPDWGLIENLFRTEFPRGILNIYLYLSRGCPFGCSFCMEPLKDRRWRALSPDEAVTEIADVARRFRPAGIAAADACFGMRSTWRKAFLQKLAKLDPDFWFVIETRPEYLDNEDIELISKIRNIEVQFGIESCAHDILLLMKKTRQPDKFLENFIRTSHSLSEKGVLHRANLIFNHPGETRRTLEETFGFINRELDNGNSSLIWGAHGYMHFPGCELDINKAYYERTFGSRFLKPEWWKNDEDQYEASLDFVPSSDLDGDNRDLWSRLLEQHMDRMKAALTDRAFRFAAAKYYMEWKADSRYEKS